jgi:hypothetical protein
VVPVSESALYEHCVRVYNEMSERAEETPEGLVYLGALTRLFEDLGFGVPYYTNVTRKLKSMDCIRQLRRGGGPQPSKWLLLQEPTPELFQMVNMAEGKSTSRGGQAALQQNMRDINNRLLRLEEWARTQGYET